MYFLMFVNGAEGLGLTVRFRVIPNTRGSRLWTLGNWLSR